MDSSLELYLLVWGGGGGHTTDHKKNCVEKSFSIPVIGILSKDCALGLFIYQNNYMIKSDYLDYNIERILHSFKRKLFNLIIDLYILYTFALNVIFIYLLITLLYNTGDELTLTVSRSPPALGHVTSDWTIVAIDGSDDPANRFTITTGTINYKDVHN